MTGGALLSVFWAREPAEQEESNTAQHKNRRIGLQDIWILLWSTRNFYSRKVYHSSRSGILKELIFLNMLVDSEAPACANLLSEKLEKLFPKGGNAITLCVC
jgi:hypothetical protein